MLKVIFLIISFLPISKLFPCTCDKQPHFINSHKDADIVCILTVESYLTFRDDNMPLSMEVSISDILLGADTSSKIIILGDRGWDCAPYLSNFPIGSTWLVAINKITDTLYYHRPESSIGDYLFLECEESYMEVRDATVNGYFYEGVETAVDYSLDEIVGIIQNTTDVDSKNNELLNEFKLFQNYPNPFNPTTTIEYTIPTSSPLFKERTDFVSLIVYDILGKEVETLVNETKKPGVYYITFDASNLASGIYYCRLKSGNIIGAKKMILLK